MIFKIGGFFIKLRWRVVRAIDWYVRGLGFESWSCSFCRQQIKTGVNFLEILYSENLSFRQRKSLELFRGIAAALSRCILDKESQIFTLLILL